MAEKIIVFQGDSVTDCGRSRETDQPNCGLGGGYPGLIAARLLADHLDKELNVYNRGISGNRVVDLYARWKCDTLNLNPAVLSILIGVNDSWHEYSNRNGVEVPRYAQFYRMLLDWTLEKLPETKLVLCEPFVLEFGFITPEWVAEMKERQEVVRGLAAEYSAVFVPLQQMLIEAAKKAGAPEKILGDGVHPTLLGHQLIADAWLKAAGNLI
ncbi:MAG TPA: SGNH/GDSL hydrolase family protein [Victivallis vadensis]|nr:SGNH/GDSL hydrolase family protein [Victivallis vadensis]